MTNLTRAALLVAALCTSLSLAAAPARPAGGAKAASHGSQHATKTYARKAQAKAAAKSGHAATGQHTKKARASHKRHQRHKRLQGTPAGQARAGGSPRH
jgi:hypothetical protein